MSELPKPTGELTGRVEFNYRFMPTTLRRIEEGAEQLGVSKDRFIVDAIDFHILVKSTRAADAVLEGIAPNGFDRESFYALSEEIMSEAEEEELGPTAPVDISEEAMQIVMLGAAYEYGDDIKHVAESMGTWEQQRFAIGSFTAAVISSYMARIQIESEGWQLAINGNSGSERMMILDKAGSTE